MGNVFVTGLTGLVGSGFLYHLTINNYDTSNFIALCRETSNTSTIEKYVKIEKGSSFDHDLLDKLCNIYHFDTLIHISNKAQIVQFAKLAAKHHIQNVIMVSSTYAQSKIRPNNSMIKYENEAVSILMSRKINYIFIRPTSIFGLRPDGKPDRNIAIFRNFILRHHFFPLFNKGNASVQPIWGRDVGQALYISLIHFNYLKNKRLTVSGDKRRTFKELILLIAKMENRKIHFIYLPKWFGSFLFYLIYVFSFTKIDKREQLCRLVEDKAFNTSGEFLNFGYTPHTFEEAYINKNAFESKQ